MTGRKKKEWVETFKNEQGVALRTDGEVEEVFRRRLIKTFQISEEENEDFCEATERIVEEWMRNNEETLKIKETIETEDSPEISVNLIRHILTSFRDKAPGPSGITLNLLLNAHPNIHEIYIRIFSACLSTGCFPI